MKRGISPRKGLIFLWALALFAWWLRYHPLGSELLVFDDDARQHVYWTARFQDPDLFADDLLTEFISSPVMDPLGYQVIYRFGTYLLDPLPFSQLLTLILLLISLWLLDRLAREIIPDPRGRLFCGGLFLFFSLYDASGGFPRGFAFPLLLGFLVLLQKGAFRWMAGVLLLEAVLYPPILLNSLALAGWDLLSRWFRGLRGNRWWGDVLWMVAAVAVAGGVLFSIYGGTDRALLGDRVTLEAARAMPEFHPGGRSVFFRENLAAYLLLGRSGIEAIHLIGFCVILVFMGAISWPRRIRIPPLALHLVWTSLILFAAAHLLLFRLHLPSRYTLYTLPLAFMLTLGSSTVGFLEAMEPAWIWLRGKGLVGRTSGRLKWGALGLLALVYAYVQGHYICRVDSQMVALERVDLELIEFLRTLPKDALVAGHPGDMNNVPLLAARKVLMNHELSLPYYLGYYERVRERVDDFFEAYYADGWHQVEAFVSRYGIYALVIRRAHFEKGFLGGRIYFEPFNTAVKARLQPEEGFALLEPPTHQKCFENDRYVVLCFAPTEALGSALISRARARFSGPEREPPWPDLLRTSR